MRTVAILPSGDWCEVGANPVMFVTVSEQWFCSLVSGEVSPDETVGRATVTHEDATTVHGVLNEEPDGWTPDAHEGCMCDRGAV